MGEKLSSRKPSGGANFLDVPTIPIVILPRGRLRRSQERRVQKPKRPRAQRILQIEKKKRRTQISLHQKLLGNLKKKKCKLHWGDSDRTSNTTVNFMPSRGVRIWNRLMKNGQFRSLEKNGKKT